MAIFTIPNLVKLAMAVASSAYSYYANKKMMDDRKKKPTSDDRPTTTTTRGAYLPLLIGRRRLGPIVAWVVDRQTVGETVTETAGHLLCVGPASRIYRIFENGKIIFSQQLERYSGTSGTLSGSTFNTSNGRSFTIYWGENLPPASGAPPELGSELPRVCYIVWTALELEGNLWPEFTYDIGVDPLPNGDGIGTSIVGSPPEVGDYEDIQDTQNGFPGANYVEILGDHSAEYTGANALIRFDQVPEDQTSGSWIITITNNGTPPPVITNASTLTRQSTTWDGEVLSFDFNRWYVVAAYQDLGPGDLYFTTTMLAEYTLQNLPAEGKTIRISVDIATGRGDRLDNFNQISIISNAVVKGSIKHLGYLYDNPESVTGEVITGDVRFTKYNVEIEGSAWVHYDIVYTIQDNDDLEEDWKFSFEAQADEATIPPPRVFVWDIANLEAQAGTEYDIRRVSLLNNLSPTGLGEDMTLWDTVDDTNGTIEFIDSGPSYKTPPAEASGTYQNRLDVTGTPAPAVAVLSRDLRTVYPNEGDLIQYSFFMAVVEGVLKVSVDGGAADYWSATITAIGGGISYVTSDTNTVLLMEATSDPDWLKVTVQHEVQPAESGFVGLDYYVQIALTNTSSPSEVYIQDLDSGEGSDKKTRVELNDEITILTDFTGEMAPVIPEVIGGANAAGVIHQLLFEPYPYGANLDPADYDLDTLSALSQLMASENLPASVIADEGKDLEAVLANILQDIGAMMYWDSSVGQYRFKAIRADSLEDEIIDITALTQNPQTTVVHDETLTNQLVFSFSDIARKYKETTLLYDNDAVVEEGYGQTKRSRQVRIPTAIDFETAKVIAERRSQEELGRPSSFKVYTSRGVVRNPGDAIQIPDNSLVLRVLGVLDNTETNEVVLEAVTEFYGIPTSVSNVPPGGGTDTDGLLPDKDIAFNIIELPRRLSTELNRIFSPRIRGALDTVAAHLWFSTDGSTYFQDNVSSRAFAGGNLNQTMSAEGYIIEEGPVINIEGPDSIEVLDLTGADKDWRRGRQVALIGHEWFFVQKVTVLNSQQFRLDNLIRARYSSEAQSHAVGTQVYIFEDTKLTWAITQPAAGTSLSLKTQPFNAFGSLDLANIVPDTKIVLGDGTRPAPPYGINTPEGASAWLTGGDAVLSWQYRNGIAPGAGETPAGVPVGTAAPEGTFTLQVWDDTFTTLKRTETGLLTAAYTYTQANLVSDFAGEPSAFGVRVINISSAGLTSDQAQAVINLA